MLKQILLLVVLFLSLNYSFSQDTNAFKGNADANYFNFLKASGGRKLTAILNWMPVILK